MDRIIAAARRAEEAGLPFNRFTTVHWEALGVSDDLAATARLLKLIGDCARAHGFRLVYVWVRENAPGDKGRHVHILWHVPLAFAPIARKHWRRWFQLCGARWVAKGIRSFPIGRSGSAPFLNPAAWRDNLDTTLHYILKGASPDVLESLPLGGRAIPHEASGPMTGKRCGVSQFLCRAFSRPRKDGPDERK